MFNSEVGALWAKGDSAESNFVGTQDCTSYHILSSLVKLLCCGLVGGVVDLNSRRPWFEASHGQILFTVNYRYKKDKIKEKGWSGMDKFKKTLCTRTIKDHVKFIFRTNHFYSCFGSSRSSFPHRDRWPIYDLYAARAQHFFAKP